jgi:hypothetical protein
MSPCTFLYKKSDKESVIKNMKKIQDGVYQTEGGSIFIIPETEITEQKLFKVVVTGPNGTKVLESNLDFLTAVDRHLHLSKSYPSFFVSFVEM